MLTGTLPRASGPDEGLPAGGEQKRRSLRPRSDRGDRSYRSVLFASGAFVLVLFMLIGFFLFFRGLKALKVAKWKFLTTKAWQPDVHHFGIAAVVPGTVFIALVAMTVALPLAFGTSLFISEICPPWLKRRITGLVDVMAAVPSVVYGLWGLYFFEGHFVGVARWISTWFGWIPIFKVPGADPGNPLATATVYTAGVAVAGLVVGMMVTPVATSIMREAFSQAPLGEREGALALGATRWGMIRTVVIPFGRGGIIGGTMLGLGRAMGETIAVALIISPRFAINWHILGTGTISVSSLIVLKYGEAQSFDFSALFAAGLALFIITLVINLLASTIVSRSRSGALSEA